jgi:hypothetical protein
VFGLLRAWRRRRLARRELPAVWPTILERQVPFYRELSPPEQARFRELLKVFVWEKRFFAAGGLELTDEIRVVIAATAVRLVLHLDLSYYDRLTEIVVYPSTYKRPDEEGGMLGEAHSFGTVVLSWDAVLEGLRHPGDGHETGAHEFAHVLDQRDGAFDGTPPLRRFGDYQPWAEVLSEHFLALGEGRRRQRKALNPYGATNEAEFFAVATESFFERPRKLRERLPDLYEELRRFYGCDPGAQNGERGDEQGTKDKEQGTGDARR